MAVESLKLKISEMEDEGKKIQHSHNFMEHKVTENNNEIEEIRK